MLRWYVRVSNVGCLMAVVEVVEVLQCSPHWLPAMMRDSGNVPATILMMFSGLPKIRAKKKRW